MAETVSPREAQLWPPQRLEGLGQFGLIGKKRRQASLWGDAWRRLRKNKLALAGLIVVVLLSLTAVFAPILAREPIDDQNYDALYHAPTNCLRHSLSVPDGRRPAGA